MHQNQTKEIGDTESKARQIGNKKRVEYINKLKDDSDNKAKPKQSSSSLRRPRRKEKARRENVEEKELHEKENQQRK